MHSNIYNNVIRFCYNDLCKHANLYFSVHITLINRSAAI